MKRRIHLIPATCERCGRRVLTASRSCFGTASQALKESFGVVCETCVTPEEKYELALAQTEAILMEDRRR